MEWFEALILGIVQGLTEFLPVSSSGHLQIFKEILGVHIPKDLTFEIVVHAATVCSTIVVLWKEISDLVRGFFKFQMNEETKYVLKILVSMIPVAIVGFCFKDVVEEIFGDLWVVGGCLLLTALLLAFAYYAKPRLKTNISFLDAFIIGIAQACAVLPGLSRSGSTIATGILLGDNKEKVARFSFLMVLIPILGESLLQVKDIITGEQGANLAAGEQVVIQLPVLSLVVGFAAAFISGLIACRWMINLVKRGKLVWFAWYCLIVGGMVLIYEWVK